jgi:hypothetical protein
MQRLHLIHVTGKRGITIALTFLDIEVPPPVHLHLCLWHMLTDVLTDEADEWPLVESGHMNAIELFQ